MGRDAIAFSLVIDAEPDGFFIDAWEQAPWRGFEQAARRLERFRDRLAEDGREAAFGWFVRADPQIAHTYGDAGWAFDRYGEALTRLTAAGDEVGVHVHGYRWLAEAGDWVIDHGDPAWMEHATRLGVATLDAAMGGSRRSFRYGDRWFSAAAIELLRDLGISYDLTMEPDMPAAATFHPGRRATGVIPATFGAPREPYHPRPGEPLRPGGDSPGLMIVPLSVSPVPERWAPVQRLPWTFLRRLPRYPLRQRTLRIDQEPRWFRAQVSELARTSVQVRCVGRSDAFVDAAMAPHIEANLAWLARRRGLRFVTVSEATGSAGTTQG